MVLAVGCNLIAELTRGAVGPEEIFLSRPAPGDPAPYQRLGRCPVRFGQAQTGLLLTPSSLAFRLPEANIGLHEQARARLVSALEDSRRDMGGHVRHLLRPLLLVGQGRMEDVAGRLGLHPRALRRRLRQEGTTFEAIKDEVRYAAARELLMLGALEHRRHCLHPRLRLRQLLRARLSPMERHVAGAVAPEGERAKSRLEGNTNWGGAAYQLGVSQAKEPLLVAERAVAIAFAIATIFRSLGQFKHNAFGCGLIVHALPKFDPRPCRTSIDHIEVRCKEPRKMSLLQRLIVTVLNLGGQRSFGEYRAERGQFGPCRERGA